MIVERLKLDHTFVEGESITIKETMVIDKEEFKGIADIYENLKAINENIVIGLNTYIDAGNRVNFSVSEVMCSDVSSDSYHKFRPYLVLYKLEVMSIIYRILAEKTKTIKLL